MRPERRASARIDDEIEVRVVSDEGIFPATGRELSNTGLFVESGQPSVVNARVRIDLIIPGIDHPLRADCVVIYSNPVPQRAGSVLRTGMGLKFVEVSEADQQALEAYIDKARDRSTSVISTRPEEEAPASQAPTDSSEDLARDVLRSIQRKDEAKGWWRRRRR